MSSIEPDVLQLGHPRILVVGDAMLDRYVWGTADRVSPEAPVLILNAVEREVRLGGAASTAMLLSGLDAEVMLAAVVGDDNDGRTLKRLLDETHVDRSLVLTDPGRPTTTKERFLGRSDHRQPHQLLRVDTEERSPLCPDLEQALQDGIVSQLHSFDAVLISDYAKGVCAGPLLPSIIQQCRDVHVPILIDPGRGVDFANYRGATLLKPNRFEAEAALGRRLQTPVEALAAAERFRQQYHVESVVITLDRDGLVLSTADGAEHRPITPREICDITGAGDTVLATLGLALASGLTLSDASRLATDAAALQVAQPGVAPISRDQLLRSLPPPQIARSSECNSSLNGRDKANRRVDHKLISLTDAAELASEYRRHQKTVVLTNGCFDLLHCGHLASLEETASLGDVLIVALNDDHSVRALKGPQRPIIPASDRARMLASLACVDHVVIFGDATPHRLLQMIRPDILAKGGTTTAIVGREVVEAYGGRIERTCEVPGLSTTSLLSRLSTNAIAAILKEGT